MSLGQTRMQKKNTRLPNQPAFTCLIIINSKFDLYLTIWIIADTWSISLEHRRTDTCKCSNQGFKCFTTHLSRDRQRNKFPKFWSSQLIFLILKQPTGSFFSFLWENNIDETCTLVQCINSYISWSPSNMNVK